MAADSRGRPPVIALVTSFVHNTDSITHFYDNRHTIIGFSEHNSKNVFFIPSDTKIATWRGGAQWSKFVFLTLGRIKQNYNKRKPCSKRFYNPFADTCMLR